MAHPRIWEPLQVAGVQGRKPRSNPPGNFHGAVDQECIELSLSDKAQVWLVNIYLWISGLNTNHKVESNNRHNWTSIRRQPAVRQKGYRGYPHYPRRLSEGWQSCV